MARHHGNAVLRLVLAMLAVWLPEGSAQLAGGTSPCLVAEQLSVIPPGRAAGSPVLCNTTVVIAHAWTPFQFNVEEMWMPYTLPSFGGYRWEGIKGISLTSADGRAVAGVTVTTEVLSTDSNGTTVVKVGFKKTPSGAFLRQDSYITTFQVTIMCDYTTACPFGDGAALSITVDGRIHVRRMQSGVWTPEGLCFEPAKSSRKLVSQAPEWKLVCPGWRTWAPTPSPTAAPTPTPFRRTNHPTTMAPVGTAQPWARLTNKPTFTPTSAPTRTPWARKTNRPTVASTGGTLQPWARLTHRPTTPTA